MNKSETSCINRVGKNLKCPSCNGFSIKYGISSAQKQRYFCKLCSKTFLQLLGGLDGGKSLGEMMNGNSVPTVAAVPGAENASTDADEDKGHAVNEMSTERIPPVGNAGTSTQKPIEQGSNNGN